MRKGPKTGRVKLIERQPKKKANYAMLHIHNFSSKMRT